MDSKVSVTDQYFEQTTDRTAVLITLLTYRCADFKIGSMPYQNAYMFHIFTGCNLHRPGIEPGSPPGGRGFYR